MNALYCQKASSPQSLGNPMALGSTIVKTKKLSLSALFKWEAGKAC